MIKKLIFVISVLLLSYLTAFSAEDISKAVNDLFVQANKAYEQNNYDQAIALYENALGRYKINNDSIYYNLGNCYYRTNKIGKAVLNYELALKINPRDEDARYNLNYIRTLIKDIQDTNFIDKLYLLLTANELVLITLFVNICFFIFLWLFVHKKNPALKPYCLYIGIALLVLGFWAYNRVKDEKRVFAVVITTPCEVRSGPGKEYTAGLSVQEGKKVEILSRQEDWFAAGLHTEKYKGWLEKEKVELILSSPLKR
ncbi:MAG: tetratricopeptide repeat protein [Elusimicrobia bacterium]|nr:tetratricopeptide repeat protein [Elusimicrobiota bacterium]MBU2615140.1 tetratricopeptide repeat protein [Elusimicrobiota bacterium]